MRNVLLLCFLLGSRICGAQQDSDDPTYPKDYFRNPLNIPILLAGNFGECRPNHFHSGIDIKTQGKENLPVFAAAGGYVSRIKMEKGGFGHALYITHPEGYTTLYAHLNNFIPALQQYTKKMQYEKESWTTDIALTPEQFPVRKGQQIAWSGNTGASTAPHLHFEIRDTKTEHPLNPMLFGFDIHDTRPPVPLELSFYNMHESIYEQNAIVKTLRKHGSQYSVIADTVKLPSDKVGMAIHVNDFMNGSDNTLNFYKARWYMDDILQGSIRLDDIGYDVTRYLHAYIDYKLRKQKGSWYQLLLQLPGNTLDHIYDSLNAQRGSLLFSDNNPHKVRIELWDAAGNNTSISFVLVADKNNKTTNCEYAFKAKQANKWEHPNVRFTMGEADLYDDICFRFESRVSEKSLSQQYLLHYAYVPVHAYFDLSIKPDKQVPFDQRNKVVLMYSDGKSESGKAAKFESGWYKASVRNLGTYWLATDTTAPVITSMQKQNADLSKAKQLKFVVREDITSVQNFRAELDGKWICFEPRGNTFFYNFDEHCAKGKHKLIITASDENANSKTLVYNFTR